MGISVEIELAFKIFVDAFDQLLEILIGKAGFLAQIPSVGIPVAAVLRGVQSVIDVSRKTPVPTTTVDQRS